jgi:hypothetical protein
MARDAYSVQINEYEGITDDDGKTLAQIAREEAFKAAIRTQEQWRENLDKGQGAVGSHPRAYRNTGEAVGDITVEPADPEASNEFRVGGDVVQLAVAEFGRVPTPGSPPPFEAIADWARERGLSPEGEDTFEEMVDAIRWAIADNGLEPFGPGRLAAQEVGPTYQENVEERLNNIIEEQEGG